MMASDRRLERFYALSAVLTGFRTFHLRGTGQGAPYIETLSTIVGEETIDALLDTFEQVASHAADDMARLESGLRKAILSDDRFGPIARNLIKLWYVGTWYELPREWHEAYGESDGDRTFVVSSTAYTEGLLWPAIGANPSGAKPLGYAMWATPPRIDKQ
jgi:hypothetical protein